MQKRLTKGLLRRVKPDSTKDVFYWDTDQRGLGFKVSKAGTRTFVFNYSLPGWRSPRRLSIGRVGDLTLDEARAKARELRAAVAAGADPLEPQVKGEEAEERGRTVADLARRFMADHAARKSASTQRNYRMLWDRHLLPALGRRRFDDVTWDDFNELHRSMSETPYQANRMLAVASKAFELATRWGWWPREASNPARGHDRYAEKPRGQALDGDQLREVGLALKAEPAGSFQAAALRVCILTGARPTEIRTARWEDLEEAGRVLRLREAKTGPRAVYLGSPAAEIISSQPRLEGNPFVFPGKRAASCLVDFKGIWRRVKTRASLPDTVRLYDCGRHTFTTWALQAGVPLDRVKLLIGHTNADITSRYSHYFASGLLADADRVAGFLETAMAGELQNSQAALLAAADTQRFDVPASSV